MTDMIEVTIPAGDVWTLVAASPIKNILVSSVPNGWEIYISSALPATSNNGMAVASFDGSFTTSSLEAGDNVYARPFGAFKASNLVVKGMKN